MPAMTDHSKDRRRSTGPFADRSIDVYKRQGMFILIVKDPERLTA